MADLRVLADGVGRVGLEPVPMKGPWISVSTLSTAESNRSRRI